MLFYEESFWDWLSVLVVIMLYAAYGSNLHPDRLRERVPSACLRGSAVLEGWGLRFEKRSPDGSSKCSVVPSSEILHVAVYEMLPAEKPILDQFEHAGIGYVEQEIHVPGFGTCFWYVAHESHVDPHLRPYGWYKELVLVGCGHHQFPSDYVERIRQVPHIEDPDVQRHEKWMSLVNHIQHSSL
ncbi:gamma-glutamylcyclotransferase family protein [Candidatus Nitronereus thalassa]|uniref:Gamma-glutamylcyclotransferase n=1 Tax=Candidatus Nitronereus thalassa TaxID=3020898 RepID=A0ABU3K3S0_9BACT|nr:gamma-glutamylcyclotransferase family protein [Candidatus Nitronereus thalassa]MDT7041035.1 gamma-glutamylcyclotransferase [Candidatus Nitronereus thalassa]